MCVTPRLPSKKNSPTTPLPHFIAIQVVTWEWSYEVIHPLADGDIARGYVQLSVVTSKLLDAKTQGLNEGFRKNVGSYTKCLFDIRKPPNDVLRCS